MLRVDELVDVDEEYLISGGAGSRIEGQLAAPFILRRPADAARFNGAVMLWEVAGSATRRGAARGN